MGEVVLIRHGQANSEAQDEANYDRLSPLGFRQAEWVGDWLRDQGESFDRVLRGSLRRHRETADAMGFGSAEVDERLNELDYFDLSRALQETHGVPLPGPDEFLDHAPQVMEAWHRAEITGKESFASFEARVTEILLEQGVEGRRTLCITSGGVIGMVVRHLLKLDPTRMAEVLLPIRNSSIHRVMVIRDRMLLTGFNATPHLDRSDRTDARTVY